MPFPNVRAWPDPRRFLRGRAALLGVCAGLGLVAHAAAPKPPEKSLAGLAQALGRAGGGVVVDDGDIAWQDSPGFLTETFLGRPLLFLGRSSAQAPRDLYRARVRVTQAGQIIDVGTVKNLTDTPMGDDVGLETRGDRASFATLAYGKIQGISVLELPGIRNGVGHAQLLREGQADFVAFRLGDPALGLHLLPGDVELLGADEGEDVVLPSVLADEGRRQAQAPTGLDRGRDGEDRRRQEVDLVVDDEAPVA